VQAISLFSLSQVIVVILTILIATNYFIKRPLEKLTDVMGMAETGHHLARITLKSEDEMQELGESFNEMLIRLTELDAHKIQTERELTKVKEGLKYKEELESKARIIKLTNLKLENSLKNLSILYVISQTLSQTLDADELQNALQHVMTDTLKLEHFSLILKNSDEQLSLASFSGLNPNLFSTGTEFKLGECLVGKAALDRMSIYIPDMNIESRALYQINETKMIGSYFVLPLHVGDRLLGVLTLGRHDINSFSEAERHLLETVSNQVAVALDRSILYMQTKTLSVKDELTGIANRRHFQETLHMEFKKSERFNRNLSVIMIDVDYFKSFNDRYGHIRGDMALKRLAKILKDNIREVDLVARFGGEEFVVILADTDIEDARVVAQKLRHLVEEDFMKLWDGKQNSRPITISLGVASYPQTSRSEESLLNAADVALYKAKESGRNQVVIFDKAEFFNDESNEGELTTNDKES